MKEMLTMPDALKYEFKLIFSTGGFKSDQANFDTLKNKIVQALADWYEAVKANQDNDTFYLKFEGWDIKEYTLPKI